MFGAGDGDIRQTPLVLVQTAAVLLTLREEQLVLVDGVHVVQRQVTAGAEHFVGDGERVVECVERFDRVSPHRRIMRESRQNISVGTHGGGHHIGAGQPRIGLLRILRRLPRPGCVRRAGGWGFAVVRGFDAEIITLVAGERRLVDIDDGNGIPLQTFGLMDRHEDDVDRFRGDCRSRIVHLSQRIDPRDESAQGGLPALGDFLGVGAHQFNDRLDRSVGEGRVDRNVRECERLGEHRVDVQIECACRRTNHMVKRQIHRLAYLTQNTSGVQHGVHCRVAQPAACQIVRGLCVIDHVGQVHQMRQLFTMLTHDGCTLARPFLTGRISRLDERLIPAISVMPVGERG